MHSLTRTSPDRESSFLTLTEAGIYGNGGAMLGSGVQEVPVEGNPVKWLPEVLAESALTRAGAPRHLGEVHAS